MSSPPPPERSSAVPSWDVPPRPDVAAEPFRRPLVLGFVAAAVVAVVLSALAIRSLLDGTEPTRRASTGPSPSDVVAPEPSPADTAPATEVGAYRFLHETSQGPVRWDPCDTIGYRIDSRAAPAWVEDDLARGLRQVTAATGIRFESEGRTTESFFHALHRIRWHRPGPDLVILWVGQERYDAIRHRLDDRRGSLAFAVPIPGHFADRGP